MWSVKVWIWILREDIIGLDEKRKCGEICVLWLLIRYIEIMGGFYDCDMCYEDMGFVCIMGGVVIFFFVKCCFFIVFLFCVLMYLNY